MTDFPGGLSLAELKQRVDIELDTNDPLLTDYLLAAFEQAQAKAPFGTGRRLVPSPALVNTGTDLDPVWADTADPVAETIEANGRRRVLVPDAREITSVSVDGAVTEDFKAESRDGMIVALRFGPSIAPYDGGYYGYTYASLRPWTDRMPQEVIITGRFGFLAPLPANLRDAIYVLAARSYYERGAQYADSVAVGEGATADVYYRQLPPRTRMVFQSYVLPPAYAGLS